MTLRQALLPEFDGEMATTRRLLERVPSDKGEWKPHPKSVALGHLAQLISWMPGWITNALQEEALDLARGPRYTFESTDTLLRLFDENVRSARAALSMADESKREQVATVLRRLNQAWLHGRVEDLAPLVHPEVVMILPGFTGRITRWEGLPAGFRDFSQNAAVIEFREHDHQIDIAGDTAVVNSRYEMLYERSGNRYRVTGRDLWVFQEQHGEWLAVWRTMLDLDESAA